MVKSARTTVRQKLDLDSNNFMSLTTGKVKFFKYKEEENYLYRPETREGATFVLCGLHGYLYGGKSQSAIESMDMFDIENRSWRKIESWGEAPDQGRSGHTACVYEKEIIVFGGEKRYNKILNVRECQSDVRLFSTEEYSWRRLQCFGEAVEPRRNHVAVIVGKHMLTYGGVNSYGELLGDLKALSLVA